MVSGKRKRGLILILSAALGAFILLMLFELRPATRSFEGEIIVERIETYQEPRHWGLFPSTTEVPYFVQRLTVRIGDGRILDLAVRPWEEGSLSVGMRIKGTYEATKTIGIGGLHLFPFKSMEPRIHLAGNPDGVLREFECRPKTSASLE